MYILYVINIFLFFLKIFTEKNELLLINPNYFRLNNNHRVKQTNTIEYFRVQQTLYMIISDT